MFTRDDLSRRIEDKAEAVESVIAPDTTLQGSLRGEHGIRVLGSVEGDLESGGLVKVEKGGRVRGNITAPAVIVNGELEGRIHTPGPVELGPDSRMTGDIEAARIAIAEGCFFQGDIRMSGGDARPVSFVEKRSPNPSAA